MANIFYPVYPFVTYKSKTILQASVKLVGSYLSNTNAGIPPDEPSDTAIEAAFGMDLRQECITLSPII